MYGAEARVPLDRSTVDHVPISAVRRLAYRFARAYAVHVDHPGLNRVLRMVHRTDDRAGKVGWATSLPFLRRRLFVDTANHVGWIIYFYGMYRREALSAALRVLPAGGVAVDVGASIGDFTVAFAETVGADGHVYAFEPWPTEFERCRLNVELNDLENVSVFPEAIGSAPGSHDLWGSQGFNQSQSSLVRDAAGDAQEAVAVKVSRLDERLSEITRLDLVKIAAPGMDLEVLKGAEGLLARFHPAVVLTAVSDELYGAFGTTTAAIVEFLEARGYSVERVYPPLLRIGGIRIGRRAANALFAVHPGASARAGDGLATETVRDFIPVAEPLIGEREIEYVSSAVRSGWVSSIGPFVSRFEDGLAAACDARHAVSVCNGTAALHLALVSLGIGPGDEVVVPALTFVATANAVRYTGAAPIFADCDPETWCLTAEEFQRVLTPRTRAVIPVHLFGHPSDLDGLRAVAKAHGIAILEDAAEALGAEYRGRRVGAIGELGVLSFYGNKLITSGEGGAVVTNDDALAERARYLRDHAMSETRRYWHDEIGFNYRLTNIQAALGVAQLEQVDSFLESKRQIAERYQELLRPIEGIGTQSEREWARSSWWMFTLTLPPRVNRDRLASALRLRGIDTRPVFVPMHLLPAHSRPQSLPVSETIAASGLTLPSGVSLSAEDQGRVVEMLQECLDG